MSVRGSIRLSTSFALVLAAATAIPAFAATPVRAPGAPGSLDATFGGNGKVTTDLTRGYDAARAVALMADGRIVAAGTAGGAGGRFAVARYRRDGSRDTSFGTRGWVATNFTSGSDVARGVAIQDDGKIVVAGTTGGTGMFGVVRYDADGSLDRTFGGDGTVTTSFPSSFRLPDGATAVAVQPDGKIVAAGFANGNCSCVRFALVRYQPDGTLDEGFGRGGKATTHFKDGGDPAAMAIGSDGKIVVVGGNVPDVDKFQIARFDPDGTLDTTFSGNGKAIVNMGQGEEAATGVAIQRSGKVLVTGYTDLPHEGGDTFGPAKFALARLDVDGTLDSTFGGSGKVLTTFSTDATPNALAIQGDGRIVVVGEVGGAGGRFALARYERNGSLDVTFGAAGEVTTNFTADEDVAYAIAIQTDGRIVAAGKARGDRFALARYSW